MCTRATAAAALAAIVFLAGHVASAQAATVAYLRFEDSNNIGLDSSGNGNDFSGINNTTWEAIPASGQGSTFPNPVPGNGLTNAGMVDIDDGRLSDGTQSLYINPQFTVEAFINNDTWDNDARTIASVMNSPSDTNQRSWRFDISNDSDINDTREIRLTIYNDSNDPTASGGDVFGSSLRLATDIDYYVAVSFDAESSVGAGDGEAVFYVQDLTNGGTLQIDTQSGLSVGAPRDVTGTNFFVGRANGNEFIGKMDEFRYSDAVLAQSDLLVVPEPATMALLGLGGLCMLPRRRQQRV